MMIMMMHDDDVDTDLAAVAVVSLLSKAVTVGTLVFLDV